MADPRLLAVVDPPQQQSENVQGLAWNFAGLDSTNIASWQIVFEEVENFDIDPCKGPRMAAFSGSSGLTVTPGVGSVNVKYDWPNPLTQPRPVGNFIAYLIYTYTDGHDGHSYKIGLPIDPD